MHIPHVFFLSFFLSFVTMWIMMLVLIHRYHFQNAIRLWSQTILKAQFNVLAHLKHDLGLFIQRHDLEPNTQAFQDFQLVELSGGFGSYLRANDKT